ncbi:hypothetical protein Q1695_001798 [Nippostrongylus brasiliensis]|nr:hypothetical protein Q1695_001798 [Nippostrongylus brasiliensis]
MSKLAELDSYSGVEATETKPFPEVDHLPYFVGKSATATLSGVGVACGNDNGRQIITLTVRWLDTSGDAQEQWNRINNAVTHHAKTSNSLDGMMICDGPCHGIVHYTKMVEYPDCGHKICRNCQYNEISVPNIDGSPGCCVPTCVRQTLIDRVPLDKYRREAQQQGTPFVGVNQSSTEKETSSSERANSASKAAPTELLHVRILILQKLQSRVVRQKLELELPSDYPVNYILRVLEERVGFLEGLKTYYTSTSSIRNREDLNPISIEPSDNRTLGGLSGGRSVLNFVVTKPGVHIFKNK